jgi:predicted nucleotidyltransferase
MSPAARHRAALRERTISALRAHFAAHPPEAAQRVLLFGSLARGDFDGASDADILVIGERFPLDAPDAVLERGVDLLQWTPAQWEKALADRHPFAQDIARDGVELWRAA